MMAYKSKGMKAPRPSGYGQDETKAVKSAPKTKPSMQHKEPPYAKEEGMQSKPPSTKKKALPSQDAPEGASSPNGGKPQSLPKGGGVGESEV